MRFLIAITLFAQIPSGLPGRWRSAGTSDSGLGAMFEFHDDGTFNFSAGAVVEMKYRIEDGQLILPPATIGGPDQRQSMKWIDADHLLLRDALTLSRQGPQRDTSNPIVGEWTGEAEVRYIFEPAGKSLFLFPFKWQQARYSVKGATMRLEYPTGPPVEGPFHLDRDTLTIPNSGKSTPSPLRRY